ncbi:MAG: hypothetical protein GY929_08655 [Actinomycetia bacterium]|nr:hypothetical protein [Actinomycetes bacterium]
MAECQACGRYLTPTSVGADGQCPACGGEVEGVRSAQSIPWHFWVLLSAVVAYLGWRVIQGAAWAVSGLF